MSAVQSFDEAVLHVEGSEVDLIGAWCELCGQYAFPRIDHCPRCGVLAEQRFLPREGTVYARTVLSAEVTVHPVPATIVQADLGGLHISGWLKTGTAEIGSTCRLVGHVFDGPDGAVMGYCFETVQVSPHA